MTSRFTIDGSPALEAQLAATCEKVLAGVRALIPPAKLDGIALGGGYGRGEGGVLKTPAGDQPYNDLEFFVFIRGNAILAERQFRHPLHALGKSLSPEAGLEVEFKVLTVNKLRRSTPSMFYYDLIAGHRWTLGNESLFTGCETHKDAAIIPLHEATRLLFNRCSGLLYSLDKLKRTDFGEAEADFVGRNLAKAQLAFGDALLAAHGKYHWSCRERHARLATFDFKNDLVWAIPLIKHHATGVEFKLHPKRSTETRDELAERHAELSELGKKLWLWLESRRLRISFNSPHDYAMSRVDKCPETSALRNRLVNFRDSGAKGLTCPRYPRERLFHALVLLLWSENDFERIRSELRTEEWDFTELVANYARLWERFN